MQHALFEVLTGRYANGREIEAFPGENDLSTSIQDHLTRLLNARQGSLVHMPDYGLPDIAQLYQSLPYSLDDLAAAIKKSVLKYEPRLTHVHVSHQPMQKGDSVINIDINARLVNGQQVQFETRFLSGGYARVQARRTRGSR
ncbi:MAG TPA: type VI secretion system baseplate subunit TssE [Gammaproteobacteria bacterium]|nr:type VI secretion system baseplate subunit TssE [Gammaproteobacteria bacterium]